MREMPRRRGFEDTEVTRLSIFMEQDVFPLQIGRETRAPDHAKRNQHHLGFGTEYRRRLGRDLLRRQQTGCRQNQGKHADALRHDSGLHSAVGVTRQAVRATAFPALLFLHRLHDSSVSESQDCDPLLGDS